MAFPLTTLTSNFSDGKKPTQAQWYELVEQLRPYVSAADRSDLINELKTALTTGSIVDTTVTHKIITAARLANPFATDYDSLKEHFMTDAVPTGLDFQNLIKALNYGVGEPCPVKFIVEIMFNSPIAQQFFGHVLGAAVVLHQNTTSKRYLEGYTGMTSLIGNSSNGYFNLQDDYTLATITPTTQHWYSDVRSNYVEVMLLCNSTSQVNAITHATFNLFLSTASDTHTVGLMQGNTGVSASNNWLLAHINNWNYSNAQYGTVYGKTANIRLTIQLSTTLD